MCEVYLPDILRDKVLIESTRGQCYYVHCMTNWLFRTEYDGADSTPNWMGMIKLETS